MTNSLRQIPHSGPRLVESYSRHDSSITLHRVHDLALMHWLQSSFFVSEGYPVPAIFSNPSRVFNDAMQIWSAPGSGNVFAYLLSAKDAGGSPLYQPHPMPMALPIISIDRLGIAPDASRAWSTGQMRHAGWPTVDPADKITSQRLLGNAYIVQMPQGWIFKYQIDILAARYDTIACLVTALVQKLNRWSLTPETMIIAKYPGRGYFGKKLVRMTLEGEIADATEIDATGNRIYRASFQLHIHGWAVDIDPNIVPTLWTQTINATALDPNALAATISSTTDLRDGEGRDVSLDLPVAQ